MAFATRLCGIAIAALRIFSVDVKQNPALVVSLHGASGHDTDKSPFRTDVADKEGCIVAYPQGKPIYFPVFGGTVTGWDATGEENDDVKFLLL